MGFETRITGELWNVDLWLQDGPTFEAGRTWLLTMKDRRTPTAVRQTIAVKQAAHAG